MHCGYVWLKREPFERCGYGQFFIQEHRSHYPFNDSVRKGKSIHNKWQPAQENRRWQRNFNSWGQQTAQAVRRDKKSYEKYDSNVIGVQKVKHEGVSKTANVSVKQNINDVEISIDNNNFIYTGLEIEPEINTELVLDTDYTIEYQDNINTGNAKIIITGLNNYYGVKEIEYTINKKEITQDMFTINNNNCIYSGERIEPEIESTIDSKYYIVEQNNLINVGT